LKKVRKKGGANASQKEKKKSGSKRRGLPPAFGKGEGLFRLLEGKKVTMEKEGGGSAGREPDAGKGEGERIVHIRGGKEKEKSRGREGPAYFYNARKGRKGGFFPQRGEKKGGADPHHKNKKKKPFSQAKATEKGEKKTLLRVQGPQKKVRGSDEQRKKKKSVARKKRKF